MKKIIFSLLFISFLAFSWGQEVISGLNVNPQLIKNRLTEKASFSEHEPVHLPFIDDFSNYDVYPSEKLWIDKNAFINNTYCVNPPTVGVATLDALNQFGEIYSTMQATATPADTLTSRPIRLDTLFTPNYRPINIEDSIYFSFFFQPGGGMGEPWALLGDKPESNDSLLLEFGYKTGEWVIGEIIEEFIIIEDFLEVGDLIESPCEPDTYITIEENLFPEDTLWFVCDTIMIPEMVWEMVWHTKGMSLQELYDETGQYFKQVLIPITDEKYLNAGFQFRFRNYASMGNNSLPGWLGNIDQWNIDYVVLDINRSEADTLYKDVAFVNSAPTILKKYQQMPWNQFKGFQTEELTDTLRMKLTNLDDITKNTSFNYYVYEDNGNLVYHHDGGSYNLESFYSFGYQNYSPHSEPAVRFLLPEDENDSAIFIINHIHKEAGLGDKRAENDTITYYQRFYNYYAYDDGSPENGYGLSVPGSSLAYRFELNIPDTLRAVQMFFNRTFDMVNQQEFVLTVWNNDNNKPGEIIYQKPMTLPLFGDSINEYQTYKLDEPLAVSGTFYVGWKQNSNTNLNIGFDRNNDASSHIFYNTDGSWTNTFYYGALMIRPMLGQRFSLANINEAKAENNFKIYPNPLSGNVLKLSYDKNINDMYINIFDMMGRLVFQDKDRRELDLSSLNNGIYIIELRCKDSTNRQQIIISR